jgi:hypothetical protein
MVRGFGGLCTSQYSTYSCYELTRIEWLGEVVIGTDLKSNDPIHIITASSQHQHRNARLGPDAPEYIKPISPWQHDIQYYQVMLTCQGTVYAPLAVVNRFNRVTFGLQVFANQLAESDVVVNDKHAFHCLLDVIEGHINDPKQVAKILSRPEVFVRKEVSMQTLGKLTKLYNPLTDSLRPISVQFCSLAGGKVFPSPAANNHEELRNEENIDGCRPLPQHGYGAGRPTAQRITQRPGA